MKTEFVIVDGLLLFLLSIDAISTKANFSATISKIHKFINKFGPKKDKERQHDI